MLFRSQFKNRRAKAYVRNYRKVFGKTPGTWGIYTYDSVYLWARAVEAAGSTDIDAFGAQILRTKNQAGATGPITIARRTGNRTNVPVAILGVSSKGTFVLESVHR